jgi:WD40 repeat protein
VTAPLKIWDAQTGKMLRTLKGHWTFCERRAFSPDGMLIVSASDDRRLKVWDVESGELLRTLEAHLYTQQSGVHRHRRAHIGARHWSQHSHLQRL